MNKRKRLQPKAEKAILNMVGGKATRVYLSPSGKSDEYATEIRAFLDAIGVKEALVTDESEVGHFDAVIDLGEVEGVLGVKLSMDDCLWQVGARIREN